MLTYKGGRVRLGKVGWQSHVSVHLPHTEQILPPIRGDKNSEVVIYFEFSRTNENSTFSRNQEDVANYLEGENSLGTAQVRRLLNIAPRLNFSRIHCTQL